MNSIRAKMAMLILPVKSAIENAKKYTEITERKMTSELKALQLVSLYTALGLTHDQAQQCATLCADQLLHQCDTHQVWYWKSVKYQITLL
jgi:hypothetical protein